MGRAFALFGLTLNVFLFLQSPLIEMTLLGEPEVPTAVLADMSIGKEGCLFRVEEGL